MIVVVIMIMTDQDSYFLKQDVKRTKIYEHMSNITSHCKDTMNHYTFDRVTKLSILILQVLMFPFFGGTNVKCYGHYETVWQVLLILYITYSVAHKWHFFLFNAEK